MSSDDISYNKLPNETRQLVNLHLQYLELNAKKARLLKDILKLFGEENS